MHLLDLWYAGARRNRNGHLSLTAVGGEKRKWTFLPPGESGRELLRFIGLVCGGLPFLLRIDGRWKTLVRYRRLSVEAHLELHAPRDHQDEIVIAVGRTVSAAGSLAALAAPERRTAAPSIRWRRELPLARSGVRPCLYLGYGSGFDLRHNVVEEDYEDPWFRRQRFASLFCHGGSLTAPPAFLRRLRYRCQKGRAPARMLRDRIEEKLGERLGVTWDALHRIEDWEAASFRERAAAVVLDAVRHAVDASPHDADPLGRAGVFAVHQPETWAGPRTAAALLIVLDELFPRMQFVATISGAIAKGLPAALVERTLDPFAARRDPPTCRPMVRRGTVALVQVDGRAPNLALMKLARHCRHRKRSVRLFRPGEPLPARIDEVYASAILNIPASARKVDTLRRRFGDALIVGGSGVDHRLRLPPAIEALPPDYALYPELKDIAMGFLTRGCPGRCSFCVVPRKEGPVRRAADLKGLTEGWRRRRLILLDDNLLAHPDADDFLAEMAERRLEINFNQTLDILRVTPEKARLLRLIQARNMRFTRTCYHFSLNGTRRLGAVARCYGLLGFRPGDHVEFVCMYGHDTALAEDVERFRFLRSLPGAYVFVQRYLPPLESPPVKTRPFFDDRAERLIDELAGICFTENMKSMEKYYRWLSERYYQEFGRLHRRLVDTIFRYNNRDRKGHYLSAHPTIIPRLREALPVLCDHQPLRCHSPGRSLVDLP